METLVSTILIEVIVAALYVSRALAVQKLTKPVFVFHRTIFLARFSRMILLVPQLTLSFMFLAFGGIYPPVSPLAWIIPLLSCALQLPWSVIDYRTFGEGVYENGLLIADRIYSWHQITGFHVTYPDDPEKEATLTFHLIPGDNLLHRPTFTTCLAQPVAKTLEAALASQFS